VAESSGSARRATVRESARSSAVRARRDACPTHEGVVKRALIGEAEKEGNLLDAELPLLEIWKGEIATKLIGHLMVGRADDAHPPLKRAPADSQLRSYRAEGTFALRQRLGERVAHRKLERIASRKALLQHARLPVEQREKLRIGREERKIEIGLR